MIGNPLLLCDVPLRRKRKVVVSSFGEIALLEAAAVGEGYFVEGEGANGVRF
jgi:hypothetical protein